MIKSEPSHLMQEIGARLYPRRYRRFKDLRPSQEVCEWARKLDWRQNPYDRFLLRRELLRHFESTEIYNGAQNIFHFSSREEVAFEIDRLLDEIPNKYNEGIGPFSYVLVKLPWELAFKHGRVRYSRLTKALANCHDKEN